MKRKRQKARKPAPISYQERTYRNFVGGHDLIPFEVQIKETDLQILASVNYEERGRELVLQYRNQLENYITHHPDFLRSLSPMPYDSLAPKIIQDMFRAGIAAGVGPMAAVAGVMAEYVGKGLLDEQYVDEVMVENGGDIFLSCQNECTIAIFAGSSPLSNKVGIRLKVEQMPMGICTSSASVGHSLSLGQADAVTVLSSSTALADAVATRLGNETRSDVEFDQVLGMASEIEGVEGVVVIQGEHLGAWGMVELVEVEC